MRVDLRARFYAADSTLEGLFSIFLLALFFIFFYWGCYWGFCVNY